MITIKTNYDELVDGTFRKLESIDGRDWTGNENLYATKLKGKKHDFVAYIKRGVANDNCCSEHRYGYELFVIGGESSTVIMNYKGEKAKGLFQSVEKNVAESTFVKVATENSVLLDDLIDFVND